MTKKFKWFMVFLVVICLCYPLYGITVNNLHGSDMAFSYFVGFLAGFYVGGMFGAYADKEKE